jgi:uncharacterized protein
MTFPIVIRDSALGASFAVRVHPHAGRTAIDGSLGEALKLGLSAPPSDGRANEELIAFFSDLFHVSRSAVQILTGARTRSKVIRIAGRSASELELALRAHFTV